MVLVVLIGWLSYRFLTTSGRVVLGTLLILLLLNIATWVVAFQKENNHFLFTLQALTEFAGFGGFYLLEIKSPPIRRIIGSLMVVYAVAFIFLFNPNQMNDVLIGTARLLLMGLVLTYFWSLLTNMNVPNLFTHPPFWVSGAVLLNGAGTVFIFLFNRMTLASVSKNDSFDWYRGVTLVFLTLFYLLLAYSFWVSRSQARPQPNRLDT